MVAVKTHFIKRFYHFSQANALAAASYSPKRNGKRGAMVRWNVYCLRKDENNVLRCVKIRGSEKLVKFPCLMIIELVMCRRV